MEALQHHGDMEGTVPTKKRKMAASEDFVEANPSKQAAKSSPADSLPRAEIKDQTLREAIQRTKAFVAHTVVCSRKGAHADHVSKRSYFDCPRLFTGDHKASALRGKHRIDDVGEYIEQHEDFYMVIHRTYSCDYYHSTIEGLFERLQLPHQNVTIGSRIRPYLFCLKADAKEASWESEEMQILSIPLQNILLKFGCATRMIAPYLPLYHERDSIAKYLSTGDAGEHQLLEIFMAWVYRHFDAEYAEADKMFSEGFVSWKHFSKMFRPKEVVVEASAQPQAYVAGRIDASDRGKITLYCWSWTFDGRFRRKNTPLSIEWSGKITDVFRIHDLDVYPLRLDDTGIENRLRNRGTMFWGFRGKRHVSYNPGNFCFEGQRANPRYMIDMHTYYEMYPKRSETTEDTGEVLPELTDDDEIPKDPFSLLLPPTVLGYGFHDKKWTGDLVVENIKEVPWQSTAFDRLVLSPQKKRIIKALVSVHADTAASSTDIIEGKGNGLIMLLHGSPGTGKTLTAESIAELTHKPLYRVTCGDIGTEPETVEKYLESVLYIGTTWRCVVLLDEADVFLEERTQTDLQRNALVSVFLRVLEYYEGILILTSNRVGTFDEAFKSRIQLAVHYPRLGRQERTTIWTGFINDLDETNAEMDRLRASIPVLAQPDLNGRQIHNMVKSARQLALYEHQKLSYEHFETVMEVSNEFDRYLEKIHGHRDSDWAKDLGIRAE